MSFLPCYRYRFFLKLTSTPRPVNSDAGPKQLEARSKAVRPFVFRAQGTLLAFEIEIEIKIAVFFFSEKPKHHQHPTSVTLGLLRWCCC